MLSVIALFAVSNGAEELSLTTSTLSDRLADASSDNAKTPEERRRLYGRKYAKCECERPNEGANEFNKLFCNNGEQFHCGGSETCYRKGQFKLAHFLDTTERLHLSKHPVTDSFKECLEKDTDFAGNDVRKVDVGAHPAYYRATMCQVECQKEKKCNFWTLGGTGVDCFLKTSDSGRVKFEMPKAKGAKAKNPHLKGALSGPKHCKLSKEDCIMRGMDLQGKDVGSIEDQTPASCQKACAKRLDCKGWTFNGTGCIMKDFAPGKTEFSAYNFAANHVSGLKDCEPQMQGPVCRAFKPKDHVDGKLSPVIGKNHANDVSMRNRLKNYGVDIRCPSKEKMLRTPLKGTSGHDRWNEWNCAGCNCGCSVYRGCGKESDGEGAVPCCTQPLGSLRFPSPVKSVQDLSGYNMKYHGKQNWAADGSMGQFMHGLVSTYHANPPCKTKDCENRPDRIYRWSTAAFPHYLSPSVMHMGKKTTQWLNEFDGEFDVSCPKGMAMVGIESEFSTLHQDRRFKMTCGKMTGVRVMSATMRTTGEINLEGAAGSPIKLGKTIDTRNNGLDRKCSSEEVMCGIASKHYIEYGGVKDVEDRMWKIKCCRIMVARDQCHSISVDIRSVHVTKKTQPKATVVDKIQANACGHQSPVTGVMTKSRETSRTRTSEYSLSNSWSQTFSSEVSSEVGVSFSAGIEVEGFGVTWSAEAGMTSTFSSSRGFESSSSGESSSVETVETQEITSFEQGFEYEAAPNTRLVVTAMGQVYEGDVFWTGMATCRSRSGIVLETKMVDGIYHGVGVNDITLQFQTEVCDHDGFNMIRNRFCAGTDKLHRVVDGKEVPFAYKTSSEAAVACDFNKDCAGFVDEGCNDQGPFYLCHTDAVLQYSQHSCVFDRQTKMDAVEKSKPVEVETCKCKNPGEGPSAKDIVCSAGKGKAFNPTAMKCPKDEYCASHYAVDKHTKIDVDSEQIAYLQKQLCAKVPNLGIPKPGNRM